MRQVDAAIVNVAGQIVGSAVRREVDRCTSTSASLIEVERREGSAETVRSSRRRGWNPWFGVEIDVKRELVRIKQYRRWQCRRTLILTPYLHGLWQGKGHEVRLTVVDG